jgi:ribonuclease P protein component
LIVAPNGLKEVRVGVAAGRSVGNAVRRNRAKRRLRETMRSLLPLLPPGYDLMLIARRPLPESPFPAIRRAVVGLLQRAGLLPPGALPPEFS